VLLSLVALFKCGHPQVRFREVEGALREAKAELETAREVSHQPHRHVAE
jgi:hypothetical protein